MNRNVSIKQVILNDYLAFLALILPVVFFGAYIILSVSGSWVNSYLDLLIIFSAISFVSLLMLVWRINFFTSVLNDGMEALATISNVVFFRDRGRISYIYTFQGQKYVSGNIVMKTKRTRNYRIGDEVVVLVDRSKPRRAFLCDLYLK